MPDAQPRDENCILAALPEAEYTRLASDAELVCLDLGRVLFHPGDTITHVYFPSDSIISLLTELEDGNGMEVGLVGRDGMVGVSVILGGEETKVAVVQARGQALRVSADRLSAEFRRGETLHDLLLLYTHSLMSQISQSVVCNVRHTISQRLARWLLMYRDRLSRDEFDMTQEFMAAMLGVRRAGVSEAAESLQANGLIRYKRGHITITNRTGLESLACECYGVVREDYERRLGTPSPALMLRA